MTTTQRAVRGAQTAVSASRQDRKLRLFLIEFICALAVFCVAAGVCAGLLAVAYKQSADAAALDGASFACASGADSFKAARGDVAACAALCGGTVDAQTLRVWYDGDWAPCAEAEAVYTLTLRAGGERLRTAAIAVCDGAGTQLFSLDTRVFVPQGGGER